MSSDKSVISLAEARKSEEIRQRLSALDKLLCKSDTGAIAPSVSNIILIIAHDPVLSDLCGFNEFTLSSVIHAPPPALLDGRTMIPGPYPRPWQEADISYIQSYIQRTYCQRLGKETTNDAMEAVATTRRFHPVRDWLDTLKWDGKPRIDTWLSSAFGAKQDDYTAGVGSKFLIAAVRRVRQPGCKFDHMPILEGAQDMGKSTAILRLFGENWFTDTIPSKLESADAAYALQGVWVVEFAEIEQLIRNEVEVIKAFLSRSTDRFRAPYGRRFMIYPRQSVLIGTTNTDDWARDATGNRRFWPVVCKMVDVPWVTDHREQLWAEANTRALGSEPHWLTEKAQKDLARSAQSERMQDDGWLEPISDWLEKRQGDKTTVPEILGDCLKIAPSDQGKREEMRVAQLLRRLGWVRSLARESGEGPGRRWLRPAKPEVTTHESEF